METEEREVLISEIDKLVTPLLRLRDDAINHRAVDGCERRMRVDEETLDECLKDNEYDSPRRYSTIDYASGKVARSEAEETKGSKVVVNVVRGRTEISAGRLANAIMPTDDRNWEMEITPDPAMDEALLDKRPVGEAFVSTGDEDVPPQTPVKEYAQSKKAEVRKRMMNMQARIDDQLAECNWQSEALNGIFNAAKLGTCVIKGPILTPGNSTKWVRTKDSSGEAWDQKLSRSVKPTAKSVNPKNCYPSPGFTADNPVLSYHWERGTITPKELRKLLTADQSLGYIPEQIKAVLDSDPIRTRVAFEDGKNKIEQDAIDKGNSYEIWEYHGDVVKEGLEAMGREVDSKYKSQTAIVKFVNDIPIQATLYPADNMDIVYHYFQWSRASNSAFGQGIPRAARWISKVITGAWRAMMDNAGHASGGHLVVDGQLMEKVQQVAGLTVWQSEKNRNVREAMAYFQIPSNQVTYQAIIEMALRFLDLETTFPMMFQGDKITMPETLGATNILIDSANVSTENRVGWWEKGVMAPLLTGFYTYNMLDPDCPDECKGDYAFVFKGVKSLQNRELEAKMIEHVIGMFNDPEVGYKYDKESAFDQILKRYRLDVKRPEAEIRDIEEKMANQPPPKDPKIQAAEISAQSKVETAKISHEWDMAEIQAKAEEAERQRQFDGWKLMQELQGMMMEIEANSNLTLEQVKAKLSEAAAKMNLQERLTLTKAGGQVMTPPTEPGQKAAPGESFQQ